MHLTGLKKKILSGAAILICLIAVVGIIVFYSVFTSTHIFNESANHLQEIYNQTNSSFSALVNKNWKVMEGWAPYIEEKTEEETLELEEFIDARRSDLGFTNFYFINENGEGKLVKAATDADGNEIKVLNLNLKQEDVDLLKEGKKLVLDGERGDDKVATTLFAIPVDVRTRNNHIYQGFEYIGMGITFDGEAMTNNLNITAFSGKGRCYITNGDGLVLMSSEWLASDPDYFPNFLDHLYEHKATFDNYSFDKLKNGIGNGDTDVVLMTIHGTEYYLTYKPIVLEDADTLSGWMMVGIVPSSVLNSNMNAFHVVTICVMAGIFVLLAVAVIVVVVFINRQKIIEKEVQLKSRDGLFDMLTHNTSDIYVLFSPDTFVAEYVSPNVEKLLGVSREDVRADVHNILAAAVNDIPKFTTEGLKKLPSENIWESELMMKNLNSEIKYWYKVLLYRSVFKGDDSFVMMLSDRTKEKKMNADLEQALALAKAANSAKSNFLSNMSHDIRTPMNAIIGFATLLARNAENPALVREYVKKITYSGQHLLGLINDVLDMSKIESGKTYLNVEEFSIPEFLEALYTMVIPQTNAKNQSFDMHTKGRLPEVVLGDRLRLNQILLNLLSNAVKYTPVGGSIKLDVEEMEQNVHNHVHVRFIVSDNGFGMSEDFVKIIFDPFSREDTSAVREIQGTGLGMAITKNIVDLMGGTISVESKKGEGSTFYVELELAVAEKMDDEGFWKRHNITRALVVDDEEDICLNVKELMSDTGVEISYALSGHRAVEMVNEACDSHKDFNVVLLDWKMPDMDGMETAKQIRAKVGDKIPILVLTSYNFEEIEEKAKSAGIDFFLPKPFFMSSFRRAIEKVNGERAESEASAKKDISLEGLTILAAEDNEINAEIISELLEDEGVKCEIAHNGREALEKFTGSEKGYYDLILMDVQMPVMNGYEATRAIRASGHPEAKTIPILAMTANAFDDDVKMALDSGMNAHMAKPVDIEKLKLMIAELQKGH